MPNPVSERSFYKWSGLLRYLELLNKRCNALKQFWNNINTDHSKKLFHLILISELIPLFEDNPSRLRFAIESCKTNQRILTVLTSPQELKLGYSIYLNLVQGILPWIDSGIQSRGRYAIVRGGNDLRFNCMLFTTRFRTSMENNLIYRPLNEDDFQFMGPARSMAYTYKNMNDLCVALLKN